MRPVETLLARLERVKRTGPGKWIARCPTRADKSPSLAIRECDDGTVLIHDFGGASVGEIVAAAGLDLADLFPPRSGQTNLVRRPWNAADVISLAAFEAAVCAVVVGDIVAGKKPSEEDHQRLITAACRLGNITEVCRGR